MGHPPRIPVWLRWDETVVYFVTICLADRKPVLANKEAFNAFKLASSKLEHWRVLAAILMPDHLHVIVASTKEREAKLGNFSAALKRWMREELKASWKWQPAASIGCYAPGNRCTTNGFTFRKIQSAQDLFTGGKIGRIDMNSMKKSASGALALQHRSFLLEAHRTCQAMDLRTEVEIISNPHSAICNPQS